MAVAAAPPDEGPSVRTPQGGEPRHARHRRVPAPLLPAADPRAVRALQVGEARVPHLPTLFVALGSIGVKEFLYRRTRRSARTRARSSSSPTPGTTAPTASARSWLPPGSGGALARPRVGLPRRGRGIVLAAWLAREGCEAAAGAVDDLMDAAPERALVDDLREHILEDPRAPRLPRLPSPPGRRQGGGGLPPARAIRFDRRARGTRWRPGQARDPGPSPRGRVGADPRGAGPSGAPPRARCRRRVPPGLSPAAWA
jgi:hypothetical protein